MHLMVFALSAWIGLLGVAIALAAANGRNNDSATNGTR